MKRVFITFLLLAVSTLLSAQYKKSAPLPYFFEDGKGQAPVSITYGRTILETYPGGNTFASNFWDYQTNGNCLHQLFVRGDTVVIAYPSVDSTDPTGTSTRLAFYTFSTNGGVTWETPLALTNLPARSGYPEAYYFVYGGNPGVVLSGRRYNGSNARGGAWTDTFFGTGAFSMAYVPEPGRDYFGSFIGGTTYGGLFSSPQTTTPIVDSLFFCKYDIVTNNMTGKTLIVSPGNGIEGNVRYRLTSKDNNLFAMWYDNDTTTGTNDYAIRYKTSSDAGTTWGTLGTLQMSRGFGGIVNGDSCSPWFGIDAAFKPGTGATWAAVWSTLYRRPEGGQNSGDNQACKILFSSPGINGGLPVEVAGKINMNTISDTGLFFNRLALQVGVTPVSHPSIAFSDDGSRICVAFSSFQPGDTLDNFTFNEIYVTYSDNGGTNWANPVKLTNTPTWDELYPVLSQTGNTPTSFKIKFQATRGPGSQSFTDNAPTYRVYQVYKTFNPANVGVQNIGTNVPEKFSLKQNYPNPFNPETKIRFDVSKTSFVTLKVYNILGQLVETLINNEQLSAGTKEVTFNGSTLTSGIYFYTLTSANGFSQTRKMMLIK